MPRSTKRGPCCNGCIAAEPEGGAPGGLNSVAGGAARGNSGNGGGAPPRRGGNGSTADEASTETVGLAALTGSAAVALAVANKHAAKPPARTLDRTAS